VLEGDNGFLVDVGDDQAMADRVALVLRMNNENWKRMSARSYEIAQEFDWDKSAEKLEAALYRWLDQRDGTQSDA
jgi:glycosyltransferase involved in cell wall biosynthesis